MLNINGIIKSVFFGLICFFNLNGQKNHDPFARSARLPDLIFGFGYQYNTLTKNEVKSGSIVLSADYLLTDKDLLIGIEYITNLPKLNEEPSATTNQFSILQGYIHNHNIISLRLGRAIGQKFYLIGSVGLESLNRFLSYTVPILLDPVEFYIDRNKKSSLFNYKIAAFYRIGRFGYEVGLSRRGIGAKIMWYINY
tara:strand:+ start:113 stop:700 length:588 start_codon:yes stop_codon:yes gene_type:complete